MSGVRRIHLVRHAPVDGPAGVIHGPQAPADTSNQALVAATRQALLRSAPDGRIWCSPATRTRQTAAALALTPGIDARLAEQNFGDWTGRRHADLAVEYGAEYVDFWGNAAFNAPPAGESFAQQVARIDAFLSSLPPGDHIAVTHSGAIRAAAAIALRMDLTAALSLVIDPLSITLLERFPDLTPAKAIPNEPDAGSQAENTSIQTKILPAWRVAYVNRLALWSA